MSLARQTPTASATTSGLRALLSGPSITSTASPPPATFVTFRRLTVYAPVPGSALVRSRTTTRGPSFRLIVQFAPGGLVDTMARTMQPKVAGALGEQVIIENRGGAGGTLAEAPPDGYTVLFAGDAVSFNPHLFSGLPYDLFRDRKVLPTCLLHLVICAAW